MTTTEKTVLHYKVIANMAHTIEKVAEDLAKLNNASYVNGDKISIRQEHLRKYFEELERLMEKEELGFT